MLNAPAGGVGIAGFLNLVTLSYHIRVYGVYLEIGQQSMLQQIHCRKDLEKIYK